MHPFVRVAAMMFAAALGVAQAPLSDLGVDTNPPEQFTERRINTAPLLDPWEITVGPDGYLWGTERGDNSVFRLDPATGMKKTLVSIPDAYRRDTQDGVLGLALHPDLLKERGQDFVYVASVYDADPGPGRDRRLRVQRFTYEAQRNTLSGLTDVLAGLPSGGDHIGGRMVIGPDQKLYLTVGDLAANHLGNHCAVNRAQELPTEAQVSARQWDSYQGKVLRMNLDGSIPADNPVVGGVRSHLFSYGHRTPQGLGFGSGGQLYESEHGPATDDEVNLLRGGGNYGWPYVAGHRDDRSYVYANWSASSPQPCASLNFVPIGGPASVPQQKETAWQHPDFMAPLQTFFTVGAAYDFGARGNAVIAPSGLEVYTSTAIPGWKDSILVVSLAKGAMFRLKLSDDGTATVGAPMQYFTSEDRPRDVAVSADGRTLYVSTDHWPRRPNAGTIRAFTYDGTP